MTFNNHGDLRNDKDFEFFAARNYCNRQCLDAAEFHDDLLRFKYLKRLLRRYRDAGEIRERLILNHLIAIYNVWPIPVANKLTFHKVDEDLWPALKTFLIFLGFIPENEYREVTVDINIAKILRKI